MKVLKLLSFFPIRLFFVFVLILGMAASCRKSATPIVPASTPYIPSSTTPSQPATSTPITEKVYFIVSDQSPQTVIQPTYSLLVKLTQTQGLQLYSFNNQSPSEYEPGTQAIIFLAPDPGISILSNENPGIQFVAMGVPDLDPSSNLSIIGPAGFQEDQIAFIAGYTAAVVTKEYRVGIIYHASSEFQETILQSFSNGVVYYCGLCQQTYPPYYDYPILTSISEEASDVEWQNAIEKLLTRSVKTAFIYSDRIPSAAVQLLTQNGIKLLGIFTPPQGYENTWIASFRFAPEIVLEVRWNDLLDQHGGWIEEVPIILDYVNEDLLSAGKRRWIQEVIDDVVQGYINTRYANEVHTP